MNTADLRIRAAELAAQEGFMEAQPAPDWQVFLNRALHQFSWEGEYCHAELSMLTTLDQSEYPLTTPPDWKRVTDVIVGNASSLIQTDEPTLRRENAMWITTPSSNPTRFFLTKPNVLRLYPTPNVSDTSVFIRGLVTEMPLVNDADTPSLPEHFHENIAELAAYLFAKRFAKGEDLARVNAYLLQVRDEAARVRTYLMEQAAPNFQRRMKRSASERLLLGWLPTRTNR